MPHLRNWVQSTGSQDFARCGEFNDSIRETTFSKPRDPQPGMLEFPLRLLLGTLALYLGC
jgi:hypothetical protein